MNSLQAAVKNELYLMLYRRKVAVFAAFSLLLPVLLASVLNALQPQLALLSITGSFPVQMLQMYTFFWIPLFIFLLLADMFPQEAASRTLKLTLLRPITRFRAFLAKAIALGTGIASLLFLLAVVTVACSAFIGTPGTAAQLFAGAKVYAAAYVSMLAVAAMYLWIAQFFNSASGFVIFSIVCYAAAKLLPFFVPELAAFFVTSYTGWYVLWLGGAVSLSKLLLSGLFVISGIVLFFSLGYFMFERKEL